MEENKKTFSTVQEAAKEYLLEKGKPATPREIANQILKKGWIESQAKDKVLSISATLIKNIRGNYNSPAMVFIEDEKGHRLVSLPEWSIKHTNDALEPSNEPAILSLEERATKEVSIAFSMELYQQLQLCTYSLENSLEDTIIYLVKQGLSCAAEQLKKGLITRIDGIGSLK